MGGWNPYQWPYFKSEGIRVSQASSELHSNTSPGTVRTKVNVSQGWFSRFCQCHNIRQLSLQGEKLSADQPATNLFIPEFKRVINDRGYKFLSVMKVVSIISYFLQ